MTHTDQQWISHDIDIKQDFKAWELMAIAMVPVCANWVLTVLLLSMPPSEAKQIQRPLHGVEHQQTKVG